MISRYGKLVSCATALALAVALSACGGGGGGGNLMPDPPPCVETSAHGCISPAEFERRRDVAAAKILEGDEFQSEGQWGLETINTHKAHAALSVLRGTGTNAALSVLQDADAKPGAGVTVGVIDTGIDLRHPVFQGGEVSEDLRYAVDEDGRSFSHGTAVASIIAGRPVPGMYTGIAPGATLRMTAITLGSGDPTRPHTPAELSGLARGESFRQELYRHVLSQNPDMVNLSFGVSGLIENYRDVPALRNALGKTIEVLAQAGRADKTILVWAAGNAHGDACNRGTSNCVGDDSDHLKNALDASSPDLYAGLPVHIEELRGHSIAVAAIRDDGEIADFSNRCGIAAPWCIAAPGEAVRTAYFGPDRRNIIIVRGYAFPNGTSFAAPMVTGGLALMKQFFRGQLPNTALVTRLYATANKSGIYADEDIYGQGLMDLGAAVTPVGGTTLTTGEHVGDAGHSLRTTYLRQGGALGDGLSRSLAGREIAAFDALGAPFWYDARSLAGVASRPSASSRLSNLMAPGREIDAPAGGTRLASGWHGRSVEQGQWRFGLYESPTNAESSLLNLAENAATLALRAQDGLEATVFTTAGLAPTTGTGQAAEMGAMLAWRPSEKPFGVRLGWLGEPETVLASTADGAFGRLSADSVVAGLETSAEYAGWRLAADAEIGLVAPDTGGGVIADLSGLTTSAASLRADRRLTADDAITLSLSQPPRVERGRARLALPVGRTRDGAVLRESVSAELVPSGRQIDLAVRWRRARAFGGEFRAEAYVSHNPGHADAAKPVLGLLVGWKVAF